VSPVFNQLAEDSPGRHNERKVWQMKDPFASITSGIGLVLALAAPTASAASEDSTERKQMIFAFDNPQDREPWSAVNDNVMGGVSDGRVRITDRGTLEFFGSISLENNGGFASIRSRRDDMDLSSFDGLLIRVRGDGKRYDLNLRTNVRIMAGSYRAKFDTNKNVWQEIYVPFSEFVPTSFGRVRNDLPALDPSKIRSFGFLISDKQAGPFSLEVEWIKAAVAPSELGSDLSTELRAERQTAIRHWIEASISRGAPLYNAGEPRLCAELYVLTVKSLLCLAPGELTPQALERLTATLQEVEETADADKQAWVLRRALDFTLESLVERPVEPLRAAAQNAD
jgi:monofunctional biosynthetic peptidoglycan transglycosylase